MDVGTVTNDDSNASIISFRRSARSFRRSPHSFRRSPTGISRSASIIGITSKNDAAVKQAVVGDKSQEIFCRLAEKIYERFKKEEVIDVRRKADFMTNKIPNAPPLTWDARKMIDESMKLVEEVNSHGERVAGTATDSVEKFMYRAEGSGAGVGMSVAKIDVPAVTLFTDLWLLDTYAKKAEHKDVLIREGENVRGAKRRAERSRYHFSIELVAQRRAERARCHSSVQLVASLLHLISTSISGTSIRNVVAANSTTASNADNPTFHATCSARRSME